MSEFLAFFLSNHLGPNICFFIVAIMIIKNFIRELPEKYRTYKLTYKKSEIITDLIGTIITSALIIVFIGIDLIQSTNFYIQFVYFMLTIVAILILIYADLDYSK